ncbi:hypothetical protein [Pseudomonas sp. RIT-PI-S]|uniref:hypothetical protein n=1 Tax=Pseudomonas sp. RIT-PI-S TaxID=3035295 RepID=UPI0021DB5BE2|nr:hypothetical protein [Pseudomonas sp. RIT-PI-S]
MSRPGALTLRRKLKTLSRTCLHCHEIDLRLAGDGHHVVLSRYVELYSAGGGSAGRIRQHQVSVAALVRWMVKQGERTRG